MSQPKPVRMVRCVYRLQGEPEWVPMGRSRTRCPRCGAVVLEVAGRVLPPELQRYGVGPFHLVELRSPTPAAGARPQSTTEEA